MTVSQAREEREVCPINAVWSSRKWTGVKQRLDNSSHLLSLCVASVCSPPLKYIFLRRLELHFFSEKDNETGINLGVELGVN